MNEVVRDADGLPSFKASSRVFGTTDAVTDLQLDEETGWLEVMINGEWVPKIQCVAFDA